jgi:hypothetical protein
MSPKSLISVVAAAIAIVVLLSLRYTSDSEGDAELDLARPATAAGTPDDSAQQGVKPAVQSLPEPQNNFQGSAEPDPTESVYDAVFGQPNPNSPIEAIHFAFIHESRDESWASAMESGIIQNIDRSEATNWASVDKIECRSTICEILGSMPDTMDSPHLHPQDLIPDGFGLGWWTGVGMEISTWTHSYQDEGIERFVLMIVRIDEERLGPTE